MANVMITMTDGRSFVANRMADGTTAATVAALITALGSGEAPVLVTLASGEQVSVSNEQIVSMVQEAANTQPGGAGGGSEEPPRTEHFPG